jgi:organic radical activating enzyme
VIDDSVSERTLDGYAERYPSTRLLFAQPCMDERYAHHLARTLALVQARPRWRLSLQLHKIIGVP